MQPTTNTLLVKMEALIKLSKGKDAQIKQNQERSIELTELNPEVIHNKILCGDSVELMKMIPENFINLTNLHGWLQY